MNEFQSACERGTAKRGDRPSVNPVFPTGAPLPNPYIPVLIAGGSRVIKKDGREILIKGKPEEWAVSLNGQLLPDHHPTMGDRASADLYIRLLHEENAVVSTPESETAR